ncbi:MAG: hypothetical protein HKN63_03920 [Rhodobacteraceae bacterium]|nr:hypothetical protein [Paracoccaceae bacterium]
MRLAIFLLVPSVLAIPGCAVFQQIFQALDDALEGPIFMVARTYGTGDPAEGTFRNIAQVDRVIIVEDREGSGAQYEGARLSPLRTGIAETSEADIGALSASPDDGHIAAVTLEYLSDTVEIRPIVWQVDAPDPIWSKSDNSIHADLESNCDMDAIYAPEIAAVIDFYDIPATPPLSVDYTDVQGGPIGLWETAFIGWTGTGAFILRIDTAYAYAITDAADEVYLGEFTDVIQIYLTYPVGPNTDPVACSRTAPATVAAPPPVLDVTAIAGPTWTTYDVGGVPLQAFLAPDRPFRLPSASNPGPVYGPRPFAR